MKPHPWALVGPWYRSDSIGGGRADKTTAPIFQKYAATDFMERFIREPQESLKFVCEDFVDHHCIDPNSVVSPQTRSQLDDSLKFFLDVHSRFYLVVCELHCVTPGFPSTSRDQVCETGFVVRRRVPKIKASLKAPLAKLAQQRNTLKKQLLRLQSSHRSADGLVAQAKQVASKLTMGPLQQKKIALLEDKLNLKQQELNQFILANKVQLELQGWQPDKNIPDAFAWQPTEAQPQTISEHVFPLYPLIADPTVGDHSAEKRTLWYGLVPTASGEVDVDGASRFDDSDLYEIQCFVRRKKACCRNSGRNCCHGEVVWSKPTGSYRLASYFDLDGNSHRPINIKLPDLPAIKSQAETSPPGRGVNAKVIASPGSGLNFKTNKMDMPEADGAEPVRPDQQICFFAILLFFFVAFFLFRLFLPIVVFIFQLWFLLTLRFCIPPTIGLDAGIAADIKVHGPDIDLAFGADINAELEFGGTLMNKNELLEALTVGLGESVAAATFAQEITDQLAASLDVNELADLYLRMATDFDDEPENEALAGDIPLPQDGLYYFEKIKAKVAA